MKKWREEGLDPKQVKERADTWVRNAQQALKQGPEAPLATPKLEPQPVKLLPIPVVPRRFPKRQTDRRSATPRRDKKLPEIEKLVELYQDHTIQEIADMFGVSPSLVGRELQKADAVAGKRESRKQARAQSKRDPLTYANRKLPSPERIAELYQNHSLREIAAMYGACAEAVRHHLKKTGAVAKKRTERRTRLLVEIQARREEGKNWEQVAREIGVGKDRLWQLAKEAGIETGLQAKPVPCPKCDSDPYAKGLCRHCYEWVRLCKPLTPEQREKVEERGRQAKLHPRYKTGPKLETLAKIEVVKELRAQGKTWAEVGKAVGLSSGAACRLGNLAGITRGHGKRIGILPNEEPVVQSP